MAGFACGVLCGAGVAYAACTGCRSPVGTRSIEPKVSTCDIVLLVATQTELETLNAMAAMEGYAFSRREAAFGEYFDLGRIGNDRVIAIKVRMGPLLHRGAAWHTINVGQETGATGFIAVGTGFGVDPSEQNIGDILVATHMLPYDDRTVRTVGGEVLVDRSNAKPRAASASLLGTLTRYERHWTASKVHRGPLLSGSARVQNSAFRDELVAAFNPRAIGGDMEAVALATGCDANRPNWCVVKAISDFGDENRDDVIVQGRAVAADNAIRFVFGALSAIPE